MDSDRRGLRSNQADVIDWQTAGAKVLATSVAELCGAVGGGLTESAVAPYQKNYRHLDDIGRAVFRTEVTRSLSLSFASRSESPVREAMAVTDRWFPRGGPEPRRYL